MNHAAQQDSDQGEKWYHKVGDSLDCGSNCLDIGDCTPGCDCAPDCGFGIASLLTVIALAQPSRPARTRPSVPGRAGMAAIRGYQKWISHRLGTRCRHTPTCSAFGMTAVRRYGLVTGSRLTADRLRRCTAPTPYGTHDPVP